MKPNLRRPALVIGGFLITALVVWQVTEIYPTPYDHFVERHHISLQVASGPGVRKATITACGRTVALKGGPREWRAKVYARGCSDDGGVALEFLDGSDAQCRGLYVTPGFSNRIVIRDKVCGR